MNTNFDDLRASLRDIGFARSSAKSMHADAPDIFAGWDEFAASYSDLALDLYMADHGRYRRRRYAVYLLSAGSVLRSVHQPHYQSTKYNWLNGNVERWFEPIAGHVAGGATLQAILQLCYAVFAPLRPDVKTWHTEVHQFRIEASVGAAGQPTPEGVHRDGVDFVLVLLVKRENIRAGTTTLHAPCGEQISAFTLTEPGDSVWLDDQRLFHGVTPVQEANTDFPAFRDVLVVTLKPLVESAN